MTKARVLLLVLIVGAGGVVQADLSIYNSQAVLDDRGTPGDLSDDLFFFRDLARFNDMTYAEQLVSVDALNAELSGVGPWRDDWHLATSAEMQGVRDDHWTTVPSVFLPVSASNYYSGRYEAPGGPDDTHMWFEVYPASPWAKEQDWVFDTSDYDGAWAVAGRVPVPGAVLLGMLGLSVAGVRLRGRERQAS